MKKYRYNIYNLDCANCAREIEEFLQKDKRLENVTVNFSTLKLSFSTSSNITIKEINNLIKKVEPDTYVAEEEKQPKKEYTIYQLLLGVTLGIIGYFIKKPIIKNILLITSYIILLHKTITNAVKLLIKSKTINENLLITISCIGAYLVNESLEGIMVISLYIIGKILEEKALNNSRKSIKDLINLKQTYATKKEKNTQVKIKVEEVKKGDILIIKKGESVPVDGIITKGKTALDTSALTGESTPISLKEKQRILSGYINLDSIIEIQAQTTFENSMVSKILTLVEEATDKKTKTENTIGKFSKIYTPIILILAILVGALLPLIIDISYKESIYRGLTFLVISCPCAIAISVPLSYFVGIGASSKNGILVKGSNYLDNLSNLKSIIFDKTGTLTNGTFTFKDIEIYDNKYTKEELINYLVKGEALSNHPIAKSLQNLASNEIDTIDIKNYKEISGKGIEYQIDDKVIKIGNKKLCDCPYDTYLHYNIGNKHVASIIIDDGIKENAKEVVNKLHKQNIKTYMFTGDKKEVAKDIASKLSIDYVKSEMLPTDKYNEYEKIKTPNDIIAFVGDGINDAPVLKRADIGISMGGVGQESAIEASDIVIMNDDLSKIPLAIDISKYTKNIIKTNLIFALSVKFIILLLSIIGYANMWLAVFADTGVTLITILNALRIFNKFKLNKVAR